MPITPVWVDGSLFGSVYIMSRLDSGDFWVGSGSLGWFQVVSGGFGWFRVVSCFINKGLKTGLNHTDFLCASSPWPTNCADIFTVS